MSVADSEIQYVCPGQRAAISRSVHLSRLARFYPGCQRCEHAVDTGTLSRRLVEQIQQVRSQRQEGPLFDEEGAAGVCPNRLSPSVVRQMAIGFAAYLTARHTAPGASPAVILGNDDRAIAAELVAAAMEGLRWSGCEVCDVGPATSASVALAIDHYQAAGGLLVGNPSGRANTAGLRFWADGAHPISAGAGLEQLQALCQRPIDRPTRKYGERRRVEADNVYLAGLADYYHAMRPLRVAVYSSCPPWTGHFKRLAERVACEVIEVGGPKRLGEVIAAQSAHFGVSITDDGEVCRVLDESGRETPAEQLLLLVARYWLADQTEKRIALEPETRPAVAAALEQLGATVVAGSTRRAGMVEAVGRERALLAGGPSGRFWYCVGHATADALRTLTLLLVILSRSDRRLSEVLRADAAV